MDANLLWRILSAAVVNQGVLDLTEEAATHPEIVAIQNFLVEQGWLEEGHAIGMCVVTPIGHLWVDEVRHSGSLKFYEYGGKVFLLNWQNDETTVWHMGRFATIGISSFLEHFEVRLENETVTTSAGSNMENALSTACHLLADNLQIPEPLEPERLDVHMHNFLKAL